MRKKPTHEPPGAGWTERGQALLHNMRDVVRTSALRKVNVASVGPRRNHDRVVNWQLPSLDGLWIGCCLSARWAYEVGCVSGWVHETRRFRRRAVSKWL